MGISDANFSFHDYHNCILSQASYQYCFLNLKFMSTLVLKFWNQAVLLLLYLVWNYFLHSSLCVKFEVGLFEKYSYFCVPSLKSAYWSFSLPSLKSFNSQKNHNFLWTKFKVHLYYSVVYEICFSNSLQSDHSSPPVLSSVLGLLMNLTVSPSEESRRRECVVCVHCCRLLASEHTTVRERSLGLLGHLVVGSERMASEVVREGGVDYFIEAIKVSESVSQSVSQVRALHMYFIDVIQMNEWRSGERVWVSESVNE